tara:strand:- start:8019 stop:8312 length:294 start_codon:yes stop_codon:yes gene_type:complete
MTEKQNPHRGNRAGCNLCGGDVESPRRKTLKLQSKSAEPAVHVKKDGPFFRVQIVSPMQLEGSAVRPETYAGAIAARQAAGWLSKATGLPVIDLIGG